jgi:putative serine protease PepD
LVDMSEQQRSDADPWYTPATAPRYGDALRTETAGSTPVLEGRIVESSGHPAQESPAERASLVGALDGPGPYNAASGAATGAAAPGSTFAGPAAEEDDPRRHRGNRVRPFLLRGRLAMVCAVAALAALAGGVSGGVIASGHRGDDGSVAAATVASAVAQKTSSGSSTVAAIAAAVSPSVVEISVKSGSGSATGTGVIITSTGQILTNYHVISGAVDNSGTMTVTFGNGSTVAATVLGTDKSLDVAVIKATGVSGLTPAALGDSSSVAVGDQVVAIGSPEGLTGTVTSGIISAKDREVTVQVDEQSTGGNGGFGYPQLPDRSGSSGSSGSSSSTATYKAFQTDAALNPGNSGGPLLNSSGQVIGLNSAMYSSSNTSSESGSIGLGFAIPVNAIKQVLPDLKAGRTLQA